MRIHGQLGRVGKSLVAVEKQIDSAKQSKYISHRIVGTIRVRALTLISAPHSSVLHRAPVYVLYS